MRNAFVVLASTCLLLAGASIAGATGTEEAAGTEGPIEISWLGVGAAEIYEDGGSIQTAIEERFGVTLNVHNDANRSETIPLKIAAGDHADAIFTFGLNMDELYNTGAFRSIPVDMVREHAPLFAATMDAISSAAWLATAVPGNTSELRGFPRHWAHQAGAQRMPVIRLDWAEQVNGLDELGLTYGKESKWGDPEGMNDVTPHRPDTFFQTYDTVNITDLEEVLQRIVDADPVGGGRTIGMSAWNRPGRPCYWWAWGRLCQPYSVSAEPLYIQAMPDGSAAPVHILPGVKEALKTAQRMYHRGILDPETPVVDRNQLADKIAQGVLAFGNRASDVTCYSRPDYETTSQGSLCFQLQSDPTAKWVQIHAVTAPDGSYGLRHENPALPLSPPFEWFVVRHDVSDEKLARILQIYDWINFDCEGVTLGRYGIEGTHYTVEGPALCNGSEFAKAGGRLVRSQAQIEAPNTIGLYMFTHHSHPVHMLSYTGSNPDWPVPIAKEWQRCHNPGGECAEAAIIRMYKEDVFKETDYDALWSQLVGQLEAIHSEFFYRHIVSDADIDAEWPGYVETWKKAGGQKLLDELAKLDYTVADLMAGNVSR